MLRQARAGTALLYGILEGHCLVKQAWLSFSYIAATTTATTAAATITH